MPSGGIPENQGMNFYPCVFMSTSSGSSTATTAARSHSGREHGYGNASLSMAMGVGDEASWFGAVPTSRPGPRVHFAEHEYNEYIPAAVNRSATNNHPRNPIPDTARYSAPCRRHSARRQDHGERRSGNDHTGGRFSAYTSAMRRAQTCFLGRNPLAANDANFYDQLLRFRVIDTTGDEQEDGRAPAGREMVVVSSPDNLEAVMDTLAPAGSGRRIVVRALDPHGVHQHGDRGFLAFTVLPQGWPFDLVIEE